MAGQTKQRSKVCTSLGWTPGTLGTSTASQEHPRDLGPPRRRGRIQGPAAGTEAPKGGHSVGNVTRQASGRGGGGGLGIRPRRPSTHFGLAGQQKRWTSSWWPERRGHPQPLLNPRSGLVSKPLPPWAIPWPLSRRGGVQGRRVLRRHGRPCLLSIPLFRSRRGPGRAARWVAMGTSSPCGELMCLETAPPLRGSRARW